jgi:glycosyltransferase involved in cell wall biosynthesis
MYEVEIMEGKQAGMNKQITSPLRFLYVGLMASFKGVGRVLKMAESLRAKNIPFFVDLVGGGIEQQKFEDQARQLNLQEHVHFHGWQQKNALQAFYSKAHFIILPSATEGWPKVLSEGMAFGAVPLAGAVSSIPQILQESGAGLSFPVEDTDAFVNAIEDFAQHPDKWKQRSEAGIHWAPRFTYQAYQQHVLQMFQEVWGIDLAKKTGAEKI